MARSTTWVAGENRLISKDILSRKRAPIGGTLGSVVSPAWWRAGQMNAFCVCTAVNLIACVTAPANTSSGRRRPGKIGSPAASADVHVAGRKASDCRLQMAPEPAVDPPGEYRA